MIENIILTGIDGDFDFQAEGHVPEVIEILDGAISYINPMTGLVETDKCEIHGGAAIIVD